MKKQIVIITTSLVYTMFIFLFMSCASTYNAKSLTFQNELQKGDTKAALLFLDQNKFLQKKRNLLLYYLEKGKLAFLNKNYKLSNEFFNKADAFIEEQKRDVGGKILGYFLNPETETYLGEDFEKVAIHYYKALNYTFLKEYDDALVEAKRINLQLQKINEKYPEDKKGRYSTDAFALNLQGMLYEASGSINDAFISYRNAVDLYLKNKGSFMGVSIPNQLKIDLLRTAKFLGFTNEFIRYQDLLEITYKEKVKSEGGEAIVFWENGLVPYKDQTFFSFTVLPGSKDGIVHVHNEELNLTIPLPRNTSRNDKVDFADIDIFNVAFPKYVSRHPFYTKGFVVRDSTDTYDFQLGENYEHIAFKVLKDRALRDVGKAALRLAVKKTSEYLVKEENKGLGVALGLFNALSEQADTRNWQSLPQSIYYTRIPLKKGKNTLTLEFSNNGKNPLKQKMEILGTGAIHFENEVTIQSSR